MSRPPLAPSCAALLAIIVAFGRPCAAASDAPASDLSELTARNRQLQSQVENQQRQINELRQRLDAMQSTLAVKEPVRAEADFTPAPPREPMRFASPAISSGKEIRVSGEVGVGFFKTRSNGAFPHAEFRVDEARLFVEAPVWKNVYFFTGLELTTRESRDNNMHIGEMYVDIEDLFALGRHQRVNLRIGRFNIPFGDEYLSRNVMANPLITHSVADIWGIDEGVQIYGSFGPVQYNLAVQNGGADTQHDYNRDKSVTVRLSYDPTQSLHFSASAHRTGKLDVAEDSVSEIWFGGEYLGPVGRLPATQTFQASLVDLEAKWQWRQGYVSAAVGVMHIDDDRPAADDSRRAHFYSIEGVQQLTQKLFVATRFGEIHVDGGYPLVGLGDYGKLYYRSPPTKNLQRISLGLGYRFAEPLVWKIEYSQERGYFITHLPRYNEEMFSTELGLKF